MTTAIAKHVKVQVHANSTVANINEYNDTRERDTHTETDRQTETDETETARER